MFETFINSSKFIKKKNDYDHQSKQTKEFPGVKTPLKSSYTDTDEDN